MFQLSVKRRVMQNTLNKSVTTKGFYRILWENEDVCPTESWEEATVSPVKPAATFFPSALRSHAPNWFIYRSCTGGHGGIKPTHQHSLGIHSSLVHIGHTPGPHSWESKHTGHLDCTHCQPHQHHHRDTLEEQKEELMSCCFSKFASYSLLLKSK